MDLSGWNFDPYMLNSINWSDMNTSTGSRGGSNRKKAESMATSSTGLSPSRLDTNNWDGNLEFLPNFGALEYDGGGPSQQSNTLDDGNASHSIGALESGSTTAQTTTSIPPTVSEAQSINSSNNAGGETSLASRSTLTASHQNGGLHLHPMGIQSSATCPPHGNPSNNQGTQNCTPPDNFYMQQQASSGIFAGAQSNTGYFAHHGIDHAALASLASSFQNSAGNNNNNNNSHLNSLAANFILAQASSIEDNSLSVDPNGQPQRASALPNPSQPRLGHNASSISSSSPMPAATGAAVSQPTQGQNAQGSSGSKPPPFYLFDAPIELRANFMANQRRLGLPIQHDPNSYHYGETVNGFHPQHLPDQQQQFNAMGSNNNPVNRIPEAPVELIDARHGNKRSSRTGRVKNQREQKRAQKITELIEQLRLDMEKGGWKVEMRSKFHTLSQCAEYVKHMIRRTKEKEDAVNSLKSDLEVVQRKMEEDKAQESRSDPESITSSLTSNTNGSQRHVRGINKQTDPQADTKQHVNPTMSHHMSSISMNEDSSGGEERASNGSGTTSDAQGYPTDKTDKTERTGVSDITDSNRESYSNSGSGPGRTDSISDGPLQQNCEQGQPSHSSISSDAAVASVKKVRGSRSEKHSHDHKDVVFDSGRHQQRKRPPSESNSLKSYLGLDYKEVFAMSNVPQIIATTSGKIVSWNKCFLRVSGIRRSEVERMTIFSLVKPEKLPKFFEIVAQALKEEASEAVEESAASQSVEPEGQRTSEVRAASDEAVAQVSKRTDYSAMTLPCVDLPAMTKRQKADPAYQHSQLYMTVTLMAGEDPSKRCFHCVFTNKPGADGGIGIITPDLLASLFAPLERSSKKMKRHHHHHRRSKKQKRKEAEKVLSDQTKSEVGDIPEAISPMSQTDPKQSDSDEMETTMLGREAESV